ncbi:lysophospholipid acyltransferase family protein [Propionispira raffinosivorans]|uniref:lysophospholipid acyltransferase family protein n=1 Tax=Propionispira raffinosivorans TaxID=86959 RepID=UPI0003715EA8|nr:lysophospholipid acyltransferase family protein [Propionispira raffinosivorans]
MSYYISKIFSHIICLLPNRVNRSLGSFLGELTWLLVPKKRKRMAVRNILQCLHVAPAEAAQIAKKSWTRFGRMIIDILLYPKIKQNINRYAVIEGREYLEEALALGRGGIIATAHSGNWELLGGALARNGFPLVGVAQKQTHKNMDRFINEYRELIGMHVTYKTGVREMIQMLGQGWLIGLLMDQDAGSNGIITKFFNRDTACVQGPASLARFKNAPILPVFITENKDGLHTIHIYKALFVNQTKNKQDDIAKMTAQLTNIIEKHIQNHPEEWFWLHDRWKSVEKRG